MKYALSYDIGTTGVKTCLFEIGETIRQFLQPQGGIEVVADIMLDLVGHLFIPADLRRLINKGEFSLDQHEKK